jgi:hypothetical protein
MCSALKFIAVVFFCLLLSISSKSADSCRLVFAENLQQQELSLQDQLQGRVLRVLKLLEFTDKQTQRQVRKKMEQLTRLLEVFVNEGDLSDKQMTQFMDLSLELGRTEERLADLEAYFQMDPANLHRVLLTGEDLIADFAYHADLPNLGETKIYFTQSLAEIFNRNGVHREVVFPQLFRGMVSRQGADGLKGFAGNQSYTHPDTGVEYRLVELKKISVDARFLAVHSSSGYLYFFRFISNHHRVEYVAKENILEYFIQHHLDQLEE